MSTIDQTRSSRASGSEARASGASKGRGADRAICAFFVGERCFGLDVGLVGEVVEIDRVAEVPLAPPEIVGLFSLRGAPVPIVDLSSALGAGAPRSTARIALVLRTETLVAALSIDRMDGVVPAGRGTSIHANDEGESALVAGFLEVDGRASVITTISTPALVAHLERLRFARAEG